MSIITHQLLRGLTALLLSLASMSFLSWHPATQSLALAVQGFITLGVAIAIDRLFFGWGLGADCPECGTRSTSSNLKSFSEYDCELSDCPTRKT